MLEHRSPAALRRKQLQANPRSDTRIIQSAIDVKFWAKTPPSCSAVRPAICPGCGAASREPGRPLAVVGHGLRGREVEGPNEPGEAPSSTPVLARRYRCRPCGAVLVVVPRGVGRALRYTLDAINYALALWGLRPGDGGAGAAGGEHGEGTRILRAEEVVDAPAMGVLGGADFRLRHAEPGLHAPGPGGTDCDVARGTGAAADGPGAAGRLLRRALHPRTMSDG